MEQLEKSRLLPAPGVSGWSWCRLGTAASWLPLGGRAQVAALLRQAAADGADKTRDLILDSQLLTSAAVQTVAAAAVVAVLHPAVLGLLLVATAPCAWGAVRAARIERDAHHRNLGDSRLRNVFRSYTTEQTTADEIRAGTMADFLADFLAGQYRIVSGRLEDERLAAVLALHTASPTRASQTAASSSRAVALSRQAPTTNSSGVVPDPRSTRCSSPRPGPSR
ncbi:hypothetical protein ACFYUJ_32640 [Streptomyces sp. NPDC004520]|uniref:hypothetical protein n=1 Tax=Streptomyces sp. NPDC004520 TaxID=3364702 RepID=UPI003693A51E